MRFRRPMCVDGALRAGVAWINFLLPRSASDPGSALCAVRESNVARPHFSAFAGASLGMPYISVVGTMSISSSTLNMPPSSCLKTDRFTSP